MTTLLVAALLLNVYAAALVLLRAVIYRTPLYKPMLWNIFLSLLPVFVLGAGVIASSLLLIFLFPLGIAVLAVTFVVWLLLLPNSSYLITELNNTHRVDDDPTPEWFDIILVITLAMSGVANAVANVLFAHAFFAVTVFRDFADAFLEPASLLFVAVIMLLQSFGMYLGRFPRFNSWDLKHPVSFFRKLTRHFSTRSARLECLGFTLSYSVFLCLIYILTAGPVISGLAALDRLRLIIDSP